VAIASTLLLLAFPGHNLAADSADGGSVEGKNWPLARGDAESTGWTSESLAENLQVRWEFKADDPIEATPVISDGQIIVADVAGKIYAIDQTTGKEIWRKDYETGFLSSAAIHESVAVVGDFDGNLYAISVKDGSEQWKKTTEGEISGSVSFHDGNVLATSQDGKLYCFSRVDGSTIWTYQTNDQIRCSPTVALGHTFLGGCDGQLHVVDLDTGKAKGQPLPLGGPTGSTPSVRGTNAFVPIMDGAILAFDWKQGKELWRYEDEDRAQEYRNSAAATDELVIVSSQYRQVDAIAIDTGKRKWRHTLRRRADASPVVAGNDVWIASTDGRLVRLDITDGKEKWNYEIKGSFMAGPAIAGGELFIADDEGVLRCFSAKPRQQ
jgi:outer membrane protein assembly factor BamB